MNNTKMCHMPFNQILINTDDHDLVKKARLFGGRVVKNRLDLFQISIDRCFDAEEVVSFLEGKTTKYPTCTTYVKQETEDFINFSTEDYGVLREARKYGTVEQRTIRSYALYVSAPYRAKDVVKYLLTI